MSSNTVAATVMARSSVRSAPRRRPGRRARDPADGTAALPGSRDGDHDQDLSLRWARALHPGTRHGSRGLSDLPLDRPHPHRRVNVQPPGAQLDAEDAVCISNTLTNGFPVTVALSPGAFPFGDATFGIAVSIPARNRCRRDGSLTAVAADPRPSVTRAGLASMLNPQPGSRCSASS